MSVPILIFDGDCAFCTTCASFIERWMRTRARITPFQVEDLEALGATRARAEYELLWIEPSGSVYGGTQAIAKLLIDAGLPWLPLGAVLRVPPFRWLGHWVYRLVSANRHRLPGGTPACRLDGPRRPGHFS